jgi:spermidine/putrescine-binding protein
MDMKKLSDLVQETVLEKFDHKNLNLIRKNLKPATQRPKISPS